MIEENKFLVEIKCMIEILKKENSSEEKRKAHKFLDDKGEYLDSLESSSRSLQAPRSAPAQI